MNDSSYRAYRERWLVLIRETGENLTKGVAIKLEQHCLESVKLLNAARMRPTLNFKIGSQVLSYSLLKSLANSPALWDSYHYLFISLPVVCKYSLCRQTHPPILPPKPQTLGTPWPLYICTFDLWPVWHTGPEAKGQTKIPTELFFCAWLFSSQTPCLLLNQH